MISLTQHDVNIRSNHTMAGGQYDIHFEVIEKDNYHVFSPFLRLIKILSTSAFTSVIILILEGKFHLSCLIQKEFFNL